MKRVLAILLIALVSISLFAQAQNSGNMKLTAAYGTGIEAKFESGYQSKFPLLVGDGTLFSGNNLKIKSNLGVSPIAGSLTVDAVLTPIAVLELSLGGGVGSGWDFNQLGMNLQGLKTGTAGIGSALSTDSLGGIYYMGRAGAAFQFDTGAIFKGDWTSVVIRTYQEMNYKGYTGAADGIAWEFENGGAMVNGFNYKAEYILGYKMPLLANFVGAQVETYAYDVLNASLYIFADVSLLCNLQFTKELSALVAVQFTNYSKTDTTRVITKEPAGFKRIAVIATYAF